MNPKYKNLPIKKETQKIIMDMRTPEIKSADKVVRYLLLVLEEYKKLKLKFINLSEQEE